MFPLKFLNGVFSQFVFIEKIIFVILYLNETALQRATTMKNDKIIQILSEYKGPGSQ